MHVTFDEKGFTKIFFVAIITLLLFIVTSEISNEKDLIAVLYSGLKKTASQRISEKGNDCYEKLYSGTKTDILH